MSTRSARTHLPTYTIYEMLSCTCKVHTARRRRVLYISHCRVTHSASPLPSSWSSTLHSCTMCARVHRIAMSRRAQQFACMLANSPCKWFAVAAPPLSSLCDIVVLFSSAANLNLDAAFGSTSIRLRKQQQQHVHVHTLLRCADYDDICRLRTTRPKLWAALRPQ